jgi:hypothetical protein
MVNPSLPPSETLLLIKKLADSNNKMRRELKRLQAMKNPNPIKAQAEQGEEEQGEQGEEEQGEEERTKVRRIRNIGGFKHGGDDGPTAKGSSHKHLPSGGKPDNKAGDARGTTDPNIDIDPDDIAGQEEISVRVSRIPRGPKEGTGTPRWSSTGYIDPDDAGGGDNTDAKTAGMKVGTITRREQVVRTVPSPKNKKDGISDDDKAEEGTDVSQVPLGRGVKLASEQGEEEQGEEEEARKLAGQLERLYPGYKVVLQQEQGEQGEEEQGEEEQGEEQEEVNPILKAAGIQMSAINRELEDAGLMGPVKAQEQVALIEAHANSLPREAYEALARNARMIQVLSGGKLARESTTVRVTGSRRVVETQAYSGLPALQHGPGGTRLNPMNKAMGILRELEKDHTLTAQERARIAFGSIYGDIINANRRNPLGN